jgi:PhnB protein
MAPDRLPAGYHAVTPWIISADSDALIAYVLAAFDAEELARVPGEAGRIEHAEVRIGDSTVMMFDSRTNWPPTPAFLRLYTADADAAHAQAVAAGGTSVTDVTPLFFGDRVGRVRDPLGNIWWLQSHVDDVDPQEMTRRAQQPEQLAAMAYVQSSLTVAMQMPE